MPPKDPNLTIFEHLRDNWVAGNTSISSDPNINTGWVDPNDEQAQVNVTNTSEDPLRGGTTGASAADGAGGGGVQELLGTTEVHCWCARDWHDANPKTIVYELKEEVRRLVIENQHALTDLRQALPGSGRFVPPSEDEPEVEFHYLQEVVWVREDRP